MKKVIVADIMTRKPITIKTSMDLLGCAKIMVRKRVGSLLIVEGKKLVGLISRRDILWALVKKSKKDLKEIKAIDISPKKITTIRPLISIAEAVKRMKKLKFHTLPVIQEGQLVGMITIKDILNFNPEIYPELDEFARIREEAGKLKRIKKAKNRASIHEGICEECGGQDLLHRVNGMLICESCKNSV